MLHSEALAERDNPTVKQPPDDDPMLRSIDAVLDDMAVQKGMYVGRRPEDGDASTFVIQFGEEGRLRLELPDLSSDTSIEAVVAEAQARLSEVLRTPAPLCPRHEHALLPSASAGQLGWVCPDGEWSVRSVTMPNWHGPISTSTSSLRSWRDDCSDGALGTGSRSGLRRLNGDPWPTSACPR